MSVVAFNKVDEIAEQVREVLKPYSYSVDKPELAPRLSTSFVNKQAEIILEWFNHKDFEVDADTVNFCLDLQKKLQGLLFEEYKFRARHQALVIDLDNIKKFLTTPLKGMSRTVLRNWAGKLYVHFKYFQPFFTLQERQWLHDEMAFRWTMLLNFNTWLGTLIEIPTPAELDIDDPAFGNSTEKDMLTLDKYEKALDKAHAKKVLDMEHQKKQEEIQAVFEKARIEREHQHKLWKQQQELLQAEHRAYQAALEKQKQPAPSLRLVPPIQGGEQ